MAVIGNVKHIEALELRLAPGGADPFIIYIVSGGAQHAALLQHLTAYAGAVSYPVSQVSMVNDDIDGRLRVYGGACCYEPPEWRHAEPFLLLLHDLPDAAADPELYPRVSRLVAMAPDPLRSGQNNMKTLPQGSLIRAVVTADELTAVNRMARHLPAAVRQSVRGIMVEKTGGEPWRQVECFAVSDALS